MDLKTIEENKSEEKILSEKEMKYQEILNKKNNKIRLTDEEKIFLAEMELFYMKRNFLEKQKKEKTKRINSIIKIIKPELEKNYDKNIENELEITAVILYAVENYETISKNIEIRNYVERNRNKKIIRIKKEFQDDRTY